ncbi:MAG: L,D-transpeptidase family protein [Gammaproteobacteria bacterium]|nr:L,D-transpeptidase family protein [Gammaproteobacteria bacterium]
MKLKCKIIVMSLLATLISGCSTQQSQYSPGQYNNVMRKKVNRFDKMVKKEFEPKFIEAHVDYPPKKMALLIFKNERMMELWAQNPNQPWKLIENVHVLAASGGPGPKLREGDRQVPEGVYHISALNPFSKYDVSMRIDYPNSFDLARAYNDGRRSLGGDIYIHGGHFSIGCIAVGNRLAEELFAMVYHVGLKNVTVVIAPNDLRHAPPVVGDVHPSWLMVLDSHIKQELQAFSSNSVYS